MIEEPRRVYCVQMPPKQDRWPGVIRVRSDTMCPKGCGRTEFKKDGQFVGLVRGAMLAWWIEEQAKRRRRLIPRQICFDFRHRRTARNDGPPAFVGMRAAAGQGIWRPLGRTIAVPLNARGEGGVMRT